MRKLAVLFILLLASQARLFTAVPEGVLEYESPGALLIGTNIYTYDTRSNERPVGCICIRGGVDWKNRIVLNRLGFQDRFFIGEHIGIRLSSFLSFGPCSKDSENSGKYYCGIVLSGGFVIRFDAGLEKEKMYHSINIDAGWKYDFTDPKGGSFIVGISYAITGYRIQY